MKLPYSTQLKTNTVFAEFSCFRTVFSNSNHLTLHRRKFFMKQLEFPNENFTPNNRKVISMISPKPIWFSHVLCDFSQRKHLRFHKATGRNRPIEFPAENLHVQDIYFWMETFHFIPSYVGPQIDFALGTVTCAPNVFSLVQKLLHQLRVKHMHVRARVISICYFITSSELLRSSVIHCEDTVIIPSAGNNALETTVSWKFSRIFSLMGSSASRPTTNAHYKDVHFHFFAHQTSDGVLETIWSLWDGREGGISKFPFHVVFVKFLCVRHEDHVNYSDNFNIRQL